MKLRVAIGFLSILAATVAAASAQVREGTVEISPFAGYLWGGEFARGTTSVFDTRVDVDDEVTYGIRFGYNITDAFEIEGQWSHTGTNFVTNDDSLFGPGGSELGDLDIDYWMGYVTFNFGHGRAVPYVTLGAGVANLDPDIPGVNTNSDTRFTGSLGGGVKVFFNPHFGLRFDGRGYATSLGDSDRHNFCDDDDFFDDCGDTEWLTNGEVSFGLLFAF
jgi:Outer membrane protein beta-barrel domain